MAGVHGRRAGWLSLAVGSAFLLAASDVAQAAVVISSKPTKNMSCSAGVCAPTTRKAWLNAIDLANMLAASDVQVVTGAGATVIEVTALLSWISTNRLTLDSARSIIVKREITVAGPGGLSLVTNDGGSDGVLSFENKGSVTFWDMTSHLDINGTSYTLVNDILTLGLSVKGKRGPPTNLALARNYDASADGVYRVSPVQKELVGTFEGLGHTILNLAVDQATQGCVGFFALLGPNGTIRDVNLSDANVSTTFAKNSIGALVGCSKEGRIVRSSADGAVSGIDQYAGGLVGENRGWVIDSSANVSVSGSHCAAGGLVGRGGYIVRSRAFGSVSAQASCRSLFVGGLVGQFADIDQSFATGNVYVGETVQSFAGGLIGFSNHNTITNSYATGRVQGEGGRLGGFAGKFFSFSNVTSSYSIGDVVPERGRLGGFVGKVSRGGGIFTSVYWDIDTSEQRKGCGRGECPGILGLTDVQLKSTLPAGFDPAIWGQNPNINSGYPYLLANPPPN